MSDKATKNELNEDLLSQFETDARDGRFAELLKFGKQLNFKKIPDKYRLQLANLFRRAQNHRMGLLSLTPLFGESPSREPNAEEIAEYAVCLYRSGLTDEALRRLEAVDYDEEPKALLYRTFCLFSQWNYAEAIPLLKQYIESQEDEYQKLIGQVNLAAALVIENRPEAYFAIKVIREKALAGGMNRLLINSYEIETQWQIKQGDFDFASAALAASEKLLPENVNSFEHFFHQKWSAVLKSRLDGNLGAINKFRDNMTFKDHWETHRDLDYHSLLVKFDQKAFNHLYYGSPFEGYRKRLEKEFGAKPDDSFTLRKPGEIGPVLDVENGKLGENTLFKPGKNLHRMMLTLTEDFYRPTPLGRLFSKMFPDEYFDAYSSPTRIHQLVKRLRADIKKHDLPLEISESKGNYRLETSTGFGISRTLKKSVTCKEEAQFEILVKGSQSENLTRKDVESILDISAASANRLIKWGVENGQLEKQGSGPKSKYVFKAA